MGARQSKKEPSLTHPIEIPEAGMNGIKIGQIEGAISKFTFIEGRTKKITDYF